MSTIISAKPIEVGVGIGIGIERTGIGFGHERLDVDHAAIDYVDWAYPFCEELKGHRHAKDQLLRASQAIPLNIAEGNGKASGAEENERRKTTLDRIVAMLTKLGQRGYTIHEETDNYSVSRNDTDTDTDSDPDPDAARNERSSNRPSSRNEHAPGNSTAEDAKHAEGDAERPRFFSAYSAYSAVARRWPSNLCLTCSSDHHVHQTVR